MKYINPRPLVPVLLLLSISVLAANTGAGERPKASVETRVEAAAVGLQSRDADQRLKSAVELLRLGKQAEPAVPQLIAALRNTPEGQPVATLALGQIGEPAVKPLIKVLGDAPEAELHGPLVALSWIGPKVKEAAPAVRELLKSKDSNLVALAAYTLARISPPDRKAAIDALQNIVTKQPNQSDVAVILIMLVWLHPEDPGPIVPALIRELRAGSCMFGEIYRIIGAYGLAELGPAAKKAVPDLRKALNDSEPLVRVLAAYALAEASPEDRPEAVRILLKIAGEKPDSDSVEYQFGLQSSRTFKPVEVNAIEAVVDVLLTQEPGNRFPANFILSWVKNGIRKSDGSVADLFKETPLSTTLAAEMARRLDPEAAKKAKLRDAIKEAPPPLTRKELARWEGAWEGQSGGAEGWMLIIDGDTITGFTGDLFQHRGVLRPDPSVTPNAYDQTVTEGPDKGKAIRGIYKLKDDQLTLCYAYASEKEPADRPAEFSVPPGSGRFLQTWKRITPRPHDAALDKVMSKDDQERTGISRLSTREKEALDQWLGRLLLQTIVDAARRYRALPNNIYHYQIAAGSKVLSEELAIEKARQTLAREGYSPEEWQLTKSDVPKRKAPDGTPDEYFDRFNFRPNEGRAHFTDGKQTRTVQVRLEGDEVVCFLFFGP